MFHHPNKNDLGQDTGLNFYILLPCRLWTKRRVPSRPPECLGFQELAGESLWWTSGMTMDLSRGVAPGAPKDPASALTSQGWVCCTSVVLFSQCYDNFEGRTWVSVVEGIQAPLDNPTRTGQSSRGVFCFLTIVLIAGLHCAVLTEVESWINTFLEICLTTRGGFSNPASKPEKSAVFEGFYETKSWGAKCLRYCFNIFSVCGWTGVSFLPLYIVLHRTGDVSLMWISTKRVSTQKKLCWLISFKGSLLNCHISVISHMLVHITWWLLSKHGLKPLRLKMICLLLWVSVSFTWT